MNKQSRQLLNFLKRQNQMLKDDIKQLRDVAKLNKQALQVSINYKNQQDYQKCIPKLIKLLYEQNGKLHVRIEQLRSEIESGMCTALISEQIAFASTEQEIFLTSQLKEKLGKLRKQLQGREKKIIQLTSLKIDQKTGISQQPPLQWIRLIEYSDMNKVTKKMKDQVQKLNQQLDTKKQQIQRLRDNKQQLFKLNLILTKQLNQLKVLTSCQTTKSNNNQMSLEISNNDMTRYIKYQRKLVNQSENIYQDAEGMTSSEEGNSSDGASDSSDMEGMDEMTSEEEYNENQHDSAKEGIDDDEEEDHTQTKVNQSMQATTIKFPSPVDKSLTGFALKPKMNMTLNLNNLSLKKGFQSLPKPQQTKPKPQQTKPKMTIPKLQLRKAKQIQNLIVKKINNDQKKKKQSSSNAPIKDEKYRKLQDQLENLRKKLGNQILEKLAIQRECNFLKKIIAELQQRNILLVDRKIKQEEDETYEKKRKHDLSDNIETLLDICRDVTMNHRLRRVVMGKELLLKKEGVQCCEV